MSWSENIPVEVLDLDLYIKYTRFKLLFLSVFESISTATLKFTDGSTSFFNQWELLMIIFKSHSSHSPTREKVTTSNHNLHNLPGNLCEKHVTATCGICLLHN